MKSRTIIFGIVSIISVLSIFQAQGSVISTYLTLPPKQVIDTVKREIKPKASVRTPQANGINLPAVSGFLTIYGGYMDYSNKDGFLEFPLRHTKPKLYLVITPEIQLDKIRDNTFSHVQMKLKAEHPAKLYTFEKKFDLLKGHSKDAKDKQWYWHVSETPLPKDGIINPISMVILTDPTNIYISRGDFMTNKGSDLILPNMYVIGSRGNNSVLMETLDLKRYFEPVEMEKKKATDTKNQILLITE